MHVLADAEVHIGGQAEGVVAAELRRHHDAKDVLVKFGVRHPHLPYRAGDIGRRRGNLVHVGAIVVEAGRAELHSLGLAGLLVSHLAVPRPLAAIAVASAIAEFAVVLANPPPLFLSRAVHAE